MATLHTGEIAHCQREGWVIPRFRLPAPQAALQADYRREPAAHFGIAFNELHVLANMPIRRFGSTLLSKGGFQGDMRRLRASFQAHNPDTAMCRSLVSVGWQGELYDCDFKQMPGLPARAGPRPTPRTRPLHGCAIAMAWSTPGVMADTRCGHNAAPQPSFPRHDRHAHPARGRGPGLRAGRRPARLARAGST